MTFDNFYDENDYKLVVKTAKYIADFPDGKYNPLILFGPSGVGKTHLLSAINNRLKETHINYNIVSVSVDELINDFVVSVNKADKTSFHRKYNDADVIMIDDFELVSGKSALQKELFLVFDECLKNNKQIILCITESENNNFSEKISTRLSGGVALEMKLPNDETKRAIVNGVAKELNITLDDNEKNHILNCTRTAAEIKGLIKKISLICETEKHPTVDLINKKGEIE